jgi:hypothetical protein
VPRVAVAEFMPQIESVAVAAMNAAAETEPGGRME